MKKILSFLVLFMLSSFFAYSQNIGIGVVDPSAKLHISENIELGNTSGDSQILIRVSGNTSNTMMNNKWLYRDAAGTNWLTARLHDAISVDVSFLTPGVDTRVWWERDPNNNIQSWGDMDKTYMTIKSGNVGIGTSNPASSLDVNGDINIKGSGGINQHYGTYTADSGIRELFRVPSKSLSTGGTFTLSSTRNGFVHTSQWSWSSNHPSRGALKQINGGQYSDIPIYLDVSSNGSAILSADWGAAQSYNISIEKTAGGDLDMSSNNTSMTTAANNYARAAVGMAIAGGNPGVCPIGSVIAWHKNLSGTSSLPGSWAE